MKQFLLAGSVAGVVLLGGCQSMNWTAKSKATKEPEVAEHTRVREVPWTWRKPKDAAGGKSELPAELQAKFDQAKDRSGAPKSAASVIAEGNQLEKDGNFAAATKAYEAALSIDPVNPDAHHRLGIMADMRKDYGTAQNHYEAALRRKPHDPDLLSDFGYSHFLQGHAQQSERYLTQSLDLDPQHRRAIKNLGTLYGSQGRYDDALVAFRRLRPDAEVQQLMAEYFPKGRPIPDGDHAQVADARPAVSPRTVPPAADNLDPAALKNMTTEEIYQLMERRRLDAVRQREEKLQAELRPNLQPSLSQQEWERLAAANPNTGTQNPNFPNESSRAAPWAQNAPQGDISRGVPPRGDQPGTQPPSGYAWASPSPQENAPPVNDPPFWNGKTPPPQRPTGPANNWPNGQPLAPQGNPLARNGAPWADDGSGRNPAEGNNSPGVDPRWNSNGAGETNPAQWNQPNSYASAAPLDRNNSTGAMSPQQRAWQLGMSAGPGTMFPAMPSDAGNAVALRPQTATPQELAGPQWTNSTTPGGYAESRASAPSWDNHASSGGNAWQDAPVDVGPRSPTENWGAPSTVPWPGTTATAESRPPGNAPGRAPQPQLPVITPGPSMRGTANPNSVNAGYQPENRTGSDVSPAWYNAPAAEVSPAPRAGSVPQWPYAPR